MLQLLESSATNALASPPLHNEPKIQNIFKNFGHTKKPAQCTLVHKVKKYSKIDEILLLKFLNYFYFLAHCAPSVSQSFFSFLFYNCGCCFAMLVLWAQPFASCSWGKKKLVICHLQVVEIGIKVTFLSKWKKNNAKKSTNWVFGNDMEASIVKKIIKTLATFYGQTLDLFTFWHKK